MPKLMPIHFQTHPLAAHCGASPMDPDVKAMIGTDDPSGVTCSRCITSPSMAGMTPVTRDEYAALVRRASTSLREIIEPLDDWLDARRAEDERRFLYALALDDLYRGTPWWDLRTRHMIRQALVKATS